MDRRGALQPAFPESDSCKRLTERRHSQLNHVLKFLLCYYTVFLPSRIAGQIKFPFSPCKYSFNDRDCCDVANSSTPKLVPRGGLYRPYGTDVTNEPVDCREPYQNIHHTAGAVALPAIRLPNCRIPPSIPAQALEVASKPHDQKSLRPQIPCATYQ